MKGSTIVKSVKSTFLEKGVQRYFLYMNYNLRRAFVAINIITLSIWKYEA